MRPEDAHGAARDEALKIKAEMAACESPAQAALAGARMLVQDAANAGIEKAKALVPSARGALQDICEYTNMNLADVGRNIIASVADQMKKTDYRRLICKTSGRGSRRCCPRPSGLCAI